MNPRYVLIGWCLIFTAMFVQRPLQSLWPAMCARADILPFLPGLVLSLHMLVQGVWGYRVAAFAVWRYRRTPLVVLHLAGAVLLGLAWLTPVFPVSAMAIIVLGLYTGYAYFTAVYYASNSGRRSFNIGVNECLVGMGSFAGLFAAQWGEMLLGKDGGMYRPCAPSPSWCRCWSRSPSTRQRNPFGFQKRQERRTELLDLFAGERMVPGANPEAEGIAPLARQQALSFVRRKKFPPHHQWVRETIEEVFQSVETFGHVPDHREILPGAGIDGRCGILDFGKDRTVQLFQVQFEPDHLALQGDRFQDRAREHAQATQRPVSAADGYPVAGDLPRGITRQAWLEGVRPLPSSPPGPPWSP